MMRLNKFVARATGRSRREADELISLGRIKLGNQIAQLGAQVDETSGTVVLDGQQLTLPTNRTLIMLNKPIGFVSSRAAQSRDAKTLYELLPPELQTLKTVGRLDKDSSGLILLTDDGDFAFQMTHPKFAKTKLYLVRLNQPLAPLHQQMISDFGVVLPDGPSRFSLEKLSPKELTETERLAMAVSPQEDNKLDHQLWRVTMSEGRNRQIRRTFSSLGYTVTRLHRTNFGSYSLNNLVAGQWKKIV